MRKPQAEALTCWLTYKRSSSRRRLLKEMFKVVEPAACAGRCCVAGLLGGLDVSIRKAKAIPTRLRVRSESGRANVRLWDANCPISRTLTVQRHGDRAR